VSRTQEKLAISKAAETVMATKNNLGKLKKPGSGGKQKIPCSQLTKSLARGN